MFKQLSMSLAEKTSQYRSDPYSILYIVLRILEMALYLLMNGRVELK